ncbi:BamA/TamA family outer membrane protein [Reichenbachiella ulvae]|uniref:BamA/TamA family outer membrane protein n=1 Tax=Reichenbachiella ulvae TaxID=2980104 RepID=A0ABT3D1S4_9BACT|nr:BamA/TamA family outer membrane protein [Reichenbachiella ulvae]MCV9389398.1 BamA/TamA family outer membrane protein [Reichenbachiella ulvae]
MRCYLLLVIIALLSFEIKGQEADSLLSKKKKNYAVYPVLGYSPESKLNLGAIAFFVLDKEGTEKSEYHRPTSITPYIIFTTNKQIQIKSEFDFYFKNGLNLGLEARVFKFPDSYYGIGNENDPDVFERYGNRFVQFEGKLMKPYSSNIFYGLTYDLQYNSIEPEAGGLLELQNPSGTNGGWNMGIGPAFTYDSRNSTIYPTMGQLINASVAYFGQVLGGEYNHMKYSLDFRHYFEFLGPKNVVAYQFRTDMISGDEVPFYKLNMMGGEKRLRGIEHNRLYTDRQSMYFQVEGRQELFWRLGGVLFAGMGQVFNSFSDFDAKNTRFVYGLGGRFQAIRDRKLNIRLDVGFTDNGQSAFYLSVREAF